MLHHWKFRPWLVGFSAVFVLVLTSTSLAACSPTNTPQRGTSAAQGQTQASQTPTQSQPKEQNCGLVSGYGTLESVPRDPGSPQVEACFWQAFQHCRPAILVFITSGVEKGAANRAFRRTFTIHLEQSACVIYDARQEGPSLTALQPAETFTCTGLAQQQNALDIISCGEDGTIRVLGF